MQKKHLTKSNTFHYKNIQQTRTRREFPQPDKAHLDKATANIILNSERLTTSLSGTGMRQRFPPVASVKHSPGDTSKIN